jgi:two-component system, cell cycle sensor histidine kinase and response regulator CckA
MLAPDREAGRVLRILLVEDNPGDADLTRIRLESVPGYVCDVLHVITLEEALLAPTVDAAIIDLNLPDSTGIETLRRYRSDRPDVPTIVLSGFDDEELRQLALREGAQDFLGKDDPVSQLLVRVVLHAIERHHLVERQRGFERLMMANPDATIVSDPDGTIRFVNQAAGTLFGKSSQDLIGTSVPYEVTIKGVEEIDLVRDDERITAEVRIAEFEWDGRAAHLATIRDVTPQRKLREQLLQAQKMEAIGRLAGGIAHDFNNLLTVMVNYASFVRDTLAETDPRRADIAEVLDAATRAADLTGQLLAFSRRRAMKPAVIHPQEIAERFHRLLRRTVPADIEMDLVIDDAQPWPVFVDPVQLEQVLMNIAINAKDAMPNGGRFSTRLSNLDLDRPGVALPPGDYLRIELRDNGFGIDSEHLEHIFEPFFTTKEPGKGTGLGLATCYGIIRQAGGEIVVESTVGLGSTFTILLPRAEGETKAIDDSDASARRASAGGTETILLVEDDEAVRQSTARMLRQSGYTVIEVEDATDALVFLAGQPAVDLVLTDVVMRGMSGRQLADELATSRPELRVLFMTGYPDRPASQKVDLPPDGTLAKPFTQAELLRKVRSLLED